MAFIKVILFHALLLASVNLIFTEEQQSEKAGLFGLPDFSSFIPNFGSGESSGSLGSSGSSGGSGFGFSNLFGRNSEASSDSQAASIESEGDEHHNRLFFSLLPSLTTCNYTLQAGARCASCRQSLTCLPNNVGLLRNCRGFFRYCNNGYCSLFQGSACSGTSSSNSTASNSTASNSTASNSTASDSSSSGNGTRSFTGITLPTNEES